MIATHVARLLGFALLLLPIAWRAAFAVDLSYAQMNDTRYAASAYFDEFAKPGEVIGFFGAKEKLPHVAREIATERVLQSEVERWEGRKDHANAVLEHLRTDGPDYLVLIPDWTSQPDMDHSQDCPKEVAAALAIGALPYHLVFHEEGRTLLPRWFARAEAGQPVALPAGSSLSPHAVTLSVGRHPEAPAFHRRIQITPPASNLATRA